MEDDDRIAELERRFDAAREERAFAAGQTSAMLRFMAYLLHSDGCPRPAARQALAQLGADRPANVNTCEAEGFLAAYDVLEAAIQHTPRD